MHSNAEDCYAMIEEIHRRMQDGVETADWYKRCMDHFGAPVRRTYDALRFGTRGGYSSRDLQEMQTAVDALKKAISVFDKSCAHIFA